MITGFNTDVEHDGVVYHVQTEDKGVKSPLILSLVYVGGTILASKRTRYDDLIARGLDEKSLAERLQRQHRLICAAIHTGRIEDLKRQTERDSNLRAQPRETSVGDAQVQIEGEISEPGITAAESSPSAPPELVAPFELVPQPSTHEDFAPQGTETPTVGPDDELVFELGSIADHMAPSTFAPPAPPPTETPAPTETPTTIDQPPPAETVSPAVERPAPTPEYEHVDYSRVVDYTSDADNSLRELHINLLEEAKFTAGEFVKIQLHVGRGWDGHRSVAGAAVTLKILGSSFRPMIFSGKTLNDGTAIFYAMLPMFTSGRAAILISAIDQGERAELRRVIHQC